MTHFHRLGHCNELVKGNNRMGKKLMQNVAILSVKISPGQEGMTKISMETDTGKSMISQGRNIGESECL